MTQKFTPGPWVAYSQVVAHGMGFNDWADKVRISENCEITVGSQNIKTGDVFQHDIGNGLVRQTLINKTDTVVTPGPTARLIAAAPDMYEALKAISEMRGSAMPGPGWDTVSDAVRVATDALAKVQS